MDPQTQAKELYRILKGESNNIKLDSKRNLEIAETFEEIGFGPVNESVQQFLALFDPKKTKKIAVQKLAELLEPEFSPLEKPEVQLMLFTKLAGKADGKVTPEMLGKTAAEAGVTLSEYECQEMVNCFDADQDGKISFKEFVTILQE